jgi:hypothetical protein
MKYNHERQSVSLSISIVGYSEYEWFSPAGLYFIAHRPTLAAAEAFLSQN